MSVLVIASIYVACAIAVILSADHIAARTFKVSRQSERPSPAPHLAYVSAPADGRETETPNP